MGKRIVILYAALLALVTVLMLRLSTLALGDNLQQAATVQSSYGLAVGESRGMIYDRNLKPLVNRGSSVMLSIAPSPQSLTALQAALPRSEFLQLAPMLESGKPVSAKASRIVDAPGVESFSFPVRYAGDRLAPHVIGYLDGSGAAVAGVERGYDKLLTELGGQVRTRYDITAMGLPLGGAATEVKDSRPQNDSGLVLTLDREIQRIAVQAAAPIARGAVVVMEVSSGELLAMISLPEFDQNNVADSLNDPDSPLFNRATAAYSVGSCFKMAVAAAALQNGFSPGYGYVCPGYYELGEQRYYCHQRTGHWQMSMVTALEQSCNPYFINLGQRLGAKKLLDMAGSMGFGTPAMLCDGVSSAAGNLPTDPDEITSGELANLSFGQGSLTATPVQIAQMTAIVAGGGRFVAPTLYKGITHDGRSIIPDEPQAARKVIPPKTADTVRSMMVGVVQNGSGKHAQPIIGGAGGKTSSAQTGVFKNGEEIVHGWFSGFYPAENPKYAITVFEEGGGSGAARPAQVFAEICDGISMRQDYNLRRNVK